MSGGKGGSNQTVAYYYAPVAFAICEGPILGIKQIWSGGDLIYSDSQPVAVNTYQGGGKSSGPTVSTSYQQFGSSTQNDTQTGGSALGSWTCYLGTETQPADPTIGEGVAYRGIAYIVFPALNIGPGATIPPLTFEVVTSGTFAPPNVVMNVNTSPLVLGYGGVAVDGGDAYFPVWEVITGGTPGAILEIFNAQSRTFTGLISSPSGAGGSQGSIFYNGCVYFVGFYNVQYGLYCVNPADRLVQLVYSVQNDCIQIVSDGTNIYWQDLSQNFFQYNYQSGGIQVVSQFVNVNNGYVSFLCCANGKVYGPNEYSIMEYSPSDNTFRKLLTIFDASSQLSSITSDGSYLYIIDNNGDYIYQYDFGGNLISKWQVSLNNGGGYGSYPSASLLLQTGTQYLWIIAGGSLYKVSLQTHTLMHSLTGLPPLYGATAYYDGDYIWICGNITYVIKIDPGDRTIIAGTMELPAAVTILCNRAGIAQFDVSQLPPTPVNFVRGDTVTVRSMLQRLSQAYFFSMVDSGGTLKFVPWGQPSQAVIPLEDLGFDKVSPNAQTPYTGSRISGVDLPRSVKIRYISPALNWQKYEQIFALESYESGKEITLDLPLILDDQTAYNIAALACTLPHAERMQYSFTTSYKWLALEPGDIVTLPFGTCRILTVKMGQKNGIPVIDFTACIDGMNSLAGAGYATPALPNYQPNAGGITALLAAPSNLAATQTPGSPGSHPIATAPQIVQTVPNAGTPKMVLVEPPPLRSTDMGMRFMAGAYSTGNVFPGAAIFQSSDGGDTYTQLTTEISATLAGYANTMLPAPAGLYNENNSYTWDNVSTVDVYLLGSNATLNPATDLQVLNGANGAMLGQELIQYAQSALMTDSFGNSFYRLSRLLRGRRGTEWAMGTHQIGEPFYAIPSALGKEPYTPTMLNNAYLYKVVMMGGDLGNAPAVSYEPNGNSLRQWAVCHPAVSLDSSNDWTVSWVPRARYNGDWASGYIPTLDSDTAGWSIDVLNGTTVKRTIQVPLQQTGPWQTVYTTAMQAADGFSPGQAGITFNIYQISSQVGRGNVRSITTP